MKFIVILVFGFLTVACTPTRYVPFEGEDLPYRRLGSVADRQWIYELYYARIRETFSRSSEEFLREELEKRSPTYLDHAGQVAFYDLNDDGIDELILYVANIVDCGTIGCYVPIYERRSGEWKLIGEPLSPRKVSQERIAGYRTLLAHRWTARWNPSLDMYDGNCVDPDTRIEDGGVCLEEKG